VNQNLKNETSDDIERRKPKKITGKITRERILGEGSRIFQEKGFRNTRVNDIINYLNIGKGSFYSYFSNKEELFLECAPLIFEKFFSEGLEKVKTEKDPFKRLSIRAEIVIPVIREFSTILRLSREAMKETDPNLKNLGEKIYRSICHPIEADIAKGIKQGTFRAVNPKIYSYFMIGIIEQIDDALTMNPDISSTSIKNAISDILTRILLASL
jgi:AcrR family transcriptional regulator